MTLNKLKKDKQNVDAATECTEIEKRQAKKRNDVIEYPTSKDMDDKNNYMFLQVFSAMTDCYIQEEETEHQQRTDNH